MCLIFGACYISDELNVFTGGQGAEQRVVHGDAVVRGKYQGIFQKVCIGDQTDPQVSYRAKRRHSVFGSHVAALDVFPDHVRGFDEYICRRYQVGHAGMMKCDELLDDWRVLFGKDVF